MGPIDHYDRCDVRLNNIAPPLSELLPSPNLGQLLIGTLVNDREVSLIHATRIAV